MGLLNELGVDTSAKELNEAQTVSKGGALASGVYSMQVEKAYYKKSAKGAMGISVELKYAVEGEADLGTFYWSTYFTSGDEKGNKTTYEKDGKTFPLPGLIELNHFFQAVGVSDPATKKAKIQINGDDVEVKAIPSITGKKLTIGIRQKFDDYKEQDVAFVDAFLDENGKNKDGDDLLADLTEKIAKSPYKKSKTKAKSTAKPSTGNSAEAGEAAASGW